MTQIIMCYKHMLLGKRCTPSCENYKNCITSKIGCWENDYFRAKEYDRIFGIGVTVGGEQS